ncbi:hypothetical protein RFI_30436, partial [Reticulomyxa filosa]
EFNSFRVIWEVKNLKIHKEPLNPYSMTLKQGLQKMKDKLLQIAGDAMSGKEEVIALDCDFNKCQPPIQAYINVDDMSLHDMYKHLLDYPNMQVYWEIEGTFMIPDKHVIDVRESKIGHAVDVDDMLTPLIERPAFNPFFYACDLHKCKLTQNVEPLSDENAMKNILQKVIRNGYLCDLINKNQTNAHEMIKQKLHYNENNVNELIMNDKVLTVINDVKQLYHADIHKYMGYPLQLHHICALLLYTEKSCNVEFGYGQMFRHEKSIFIQNSFFKPYLRIVESPNMHLVFNKSVKNYTKFVDKKRYKFYFVFLIIFKRLRYLSIVNQQKKKPRIHFGISRMSLKATVYIEAKKKSYEITLSTLTMEHDQQQEFEIKDKSNVRIEKDEDIDRVCKNKPVHFNVRLKPKEYKKRKDETNIQISHIVMSPLALLAGTIRHETSDKKLNGVKRDMIELKKYMNIIKLLRLDRLNKIIDDALQEVQNAELLSTSKYDGLIFVWCGYGCDETGTLITSDDKYKHWNAIVNVYEDITPRFTKRSKIIIQNCIESKMSCEMKTDEIKSWNNSDIY